MNGYGTADIMLNTIPMLGKLAVLNPVYIGDFIDRIVNPNGAFEEDADHIPFGNDVHYLHIWLQAQKPSAKLNKACFSVPYACVVLPVVVSHITVDIAEVPSVEHLTVKPLDQLSVCHNNSLSDIFRLKPSKLTGYPAQVPRQPPQVFSPVRNEGERRFEK